MRKKFIAGNWKMYTSLNGAKDLAAAVAKGVADDRVLVALFPPFPWLLPVADVLKGSKVALGSQNCHNAVEGAFTGDVAPKMLKEAGCQYVIVGHSEPARHGRAGFFSQSQTEGSPRRGIVSGSVRRRNVDRARKQPNRGSSALSTSGRSHRPRTAQLDKLTIAYEPVWAIGTGKVATPAQAQDAHAFIRAQITKHFGEKSAQTLLIQYGGSVKPDNAAEILKQPDVDGALVGGASLKADSFLAIVNAGR